MKRLFIGWLLLTKLLTQDPDIAHSKVVDFSAVNRSNIATVLEDNQTPVRLNKISAKETTLATLLMKKEFHKDFMKELKNWQDSFFETIIYFSNENIVKEYFYDEILKEFWKRDFSIEILDKYFIDKYGKNLYGIISKFFLDTMLLISLENPDYNIFTDGEFYELTPELLTVFQNYGLDISGEYNKFSFRKEKDGNISMITSDSWETTVITTLPKKDIDNSYNIVFKMVRELIQMIN